MNLELLDEPFPACDVEWRIQQAKKGGQSGVWCMVLCYVTNRAIMNRLDQVFGKGGWQNQYRDIEGGKSVECGISAKIDGEWITKWDAADNTQVEATKGGRSNAMKRAAVQFGIGRYLYKLDATFAEVVVGNNKPNQQGEWNKGSIKDGSQWISYWWKTPTLPEWALPKNKLETVSEAIEQWIMNSKTAGKTLEQIISALKVKYTLSKEATEIITETYEGA